MMTLKLASVIVICFSVFLEITQVVSSQNQNPETRSNARDRDEPSSRQGEYTFLSSSRGQTKNGRVACFQSYRSKNGTMIFTTTEYFLTRAEANTRFASDVKRLSEVTELVEESEDQGSSKEKRVVGKCLPNEQGIDEYTIITCKNSEILYLRSLSLEQLLDFETKILKLGRSTQTGS